MSIVSFWGAAAPTGTITWNTDGTPSIELGTGFYTIANSPLRGKNCVGGRVYIPAGNAGTSLEMRLHVAPSNGAAALITDTPIRSTVGIQVTNNDAHWLEANWDTPYVMPNDSRIVALVYRFTSPAGGYVAVSGTRPSPSPLAARDPSLLLYWSEDAGSYSGSFFRIGGGAQSTTVNFATTYAGDLLFDIPSGPGNTVPTANAGVDQNVVIGSQVTLTGGGTDTDGSIVSYTWTQVSGPTVTLAGTGNVRTFTPSTVGTYVFGLRVTDNSGALSSQDTISVVVSEVPATRTVAQENAQTTGVQSPSFWYEGVGSEQMPAFARSTYYLPGQQAAFSVNFNQAFTGEVWRLGHYGGSGARKVDTVTGIPTAQPTPTVIPNSNGAVTCAAWSNNLLWTIPQDAVPGWYYVLLKGANSNFGHVLFCVSDGNDKKKTLIVTGDATWHAAYNGFGGNNIYGAEKSIGSAVNRALCSTYDKPVITRDYVPQTHFLNASYPFLKYSESVGVDAGYTTIEQIDAQPSILDGRDVVVFTGHNEYISQTVMDKVKSVMLTGNTNVINIAGNDFFWRVKFTNGDFTSNTRGRNMWCKKDTMSGPVSPTNFNHTGGQPFTTAADWTGSWQDTRWADREPSSEFLGDQFIANGIRADQVKVPASMKASPAWRNCAGIQSLTSGQEYSFAAGSLGMEWDKPVTVTGGPTQKPFSSTTVTLTNNAADINGENYNLTETATHSFTMGVNSVGTLIANFNSDQWPWALDSLHLRGSAPADTNARQMMLNVMTDLGVEANSSAVSATGLSMPTPVSNVSSAYGLTPTQEEGEHGIYYSNGQAWTKLSAIHYNQ